MIVIDELRKDEHPTLPEDKPGTQLDRSLLVWSVSYVSGNETKDHTLLGYFGLVPVDYIGRVGYLWFYLVEKKPSRKAMQQGKVAFSHFSSLLPWTTYVYTELDNRRTRRFAEFLGYNILLDVDGYHFFGNTPHEH